MSIQKILGPGLAPVVYDRLHVTLPEIAEFCQRWKIIEFALFGSVLREDFRPDSDIDVLVTFLPSYSLTLSMVLDMQEELEAMLHRSVDLVEKDRLVNPYRRASILRTQRVIYASK